MPRSSLRYSESRSISALEEGTVWIFMAVPPRQHNPFLGGLVRAALDSRMDQALASQPHHNAVEQAVDRPPSRHVTDNEHSRALRAQPKIFEEVPHPVYGLTPKPSTTLLRI